MLEVTTSIDSDLPFDLDSEPVDTPSAPEPPLAPWVPGDIDTMQPGPKLAALLSAIDVNSVSEYDRVAVLRAHRRMASYYAAASMRAMVSLRDAYLADHESHLSAGESAAAEIRVALMLTRRGADVELSLAIDLAERLPQVLEAMHAGELDVARARAIDRATLDLDVDTAREVADTVLPRAGDLTTGQLRAWLEKLRLDLCPEQAEARYETAVEQRCVSIEATPDGTAHLHAYHLPPDRANAIMRRLTRDARKLRRKGEDRTIDQLRADVLVDLASSSHAIVRGPHGERIATASNGGSVEIKVDLETLARLAEHPGDLAGYGPVIAEIARNVADHQHDTPWHYTIIDSDTQRPVAGGTLRRRPTATMRRQIARLHPTCIFPGCRMPAADCDLDHTTQWSQGGPTTNDNLAPHCRHDHTLKDVGGWVYRINDDGAITWTSPLGHIYVVRPPPT
jgi:uncharacterized protein DUF222/HNH endonuclease